jgi:hypothetical protein
MLGSNQVGGQSMRMLLKVKIPTEQGNQAVKDRSLGRILEDTVGKLKAEAAYLIARGWSPLRAPQPLARRRLTG